MAGRILKEKGFEFDIAYSSLLRRANNTLKYILEELNEEKISIKYSWKLNERHCGALQGLNKDETMSKYGESQIKTWIKSTNKRPPALDIKDIRNPINNPKYKNLLRKELPATESLNDAIKRITNYWNIEIKDNIVKGKRIIIVGHGNILRGLIKYLYNLSDEEVINIQMKTARPICCELEDDLKPIKYYYLKDITT